MKEITIPIVTAKRKAISSNNDDTKRLATSKDDDKVINDVKVADDTTNAISLICDYGSDED